MMTPVDIVRTKVTKNKTVFISEITEARLSITSDIWFKSNIVETIEQISKAKYHTNSSTIAGRFISKITIITKTPKVFLIIKKLLKTDEIASPTPFPTIGTKVPEINLMPFNTTLSEELARMLCVVKSPVNTVENRDKIITTDFLTVFKIRSLYPSKEKEESTLKDSNALITGIKNLSAKVDINDEIKIVKELYVKANDGFFEAIIIPVIIGK